MNRLGHCASYHIVKEVETALTVEEKKIVAARAKTFQRTETWYSMG